MVERIGVKSPVSLHYSLSLKRELLLFDRIAIPQAIKFLEGNRHKEFERHEIQELEWLIEQGIVFESESLPDANLLANQQFRECWQTYSDTFIEAYKVFKEYVQIVPPDLDINSREKKFDTCFTYNNGLLMLTEEGAKLLCLGDDMNDKFLLSSDYIARLVSIQLREQHSMDAYPIIDSDLSFELGTVADKTNVVEIVLNSLPTPDESVSWEQILEYRGDPGTRDKFLSLRRWMNKLAREQISPQEIHDELEFLIHEYKRHMEFHKMKINFETWRTICVAQAELIPNLVKLKWGEIARSLFALKQRQVSLMELELSTPGKEVAYIVEAQNTFN